MNKQILWGLQELSNTLKDLTLDMIEYMRTEDLEDAEYYNGRRWALMQKMEELQKIIKGRLK